MILRHSLFIARTSLLHAWKRSLLLAFVLGVSLGVPLALSSLLARASLDMTARAHIAPLLLGAKGSESDLVFGALFFASTPPNGLTMRDLARVEHDEMARAIPIMLGASAREAVVVGTTLDYFAQREITPQRGEMFALIGECVVGANVAQRLALTDDACLFTDAHSLSDLAGVLPLELTVTGILRETGSADDDVIFVDLRTMWSIRGLGHRHADPAHPSASSTAAAAVIGQDGARAILSEALVIERAATTAATATTSASFHFHGSVDDLPLDAALVYPRDAKSLALLLGRFTAKNEPLQLIRPELFASRVLDRIFGVARVLGAVALGTALLVALVVASAFALSIRLRADELALMRRLGASRARVATFIATEALLLAMLSVALALVVWSLAPLASPLLLRMVSES